MTGLLHHVFALVMHTHNAFNMKNIIIKTLFVDEWEREIEGERARVRVGEKGIEGGMVSASVRPTLFILF